MSHDVKAGEVRHLVAAHRHVDDFLQKFVDAVGRDAAIHQEGCRLAVWVEDAIGSESHAVPDSDRRFPQSLRVRNGGCKRLLGGRVCADDFQQWHDVGGSEEVKANDTVLCVRLLADNVDIDRGGVGGKDTVLAADALQILKDLLLDGDVLDDSLHHHVAALEALVAGGGREVAHTHLHGDLRHLHPFQNAGNGGRHPLHALEEEILVYFLEDHMVTLEEHERDDPSAHRATPQHRDCLDLSGRPDALEPRHLGRKLRGQERVDQTSGTRARDANLEGLHFGFDPLFPSLEQPSLDRIEAGASMRRALRSPPRLNPCELDGLHSLCSGADTLLHLERHAAGLRPACYGQSCFDGGG
mmetsp:Transcript_11181/g.15564  ORF Transcript_11181/g.15564 Transcript_11181/m.15564 type:complete len:356 (-) Transcript_11181:313-1380(-)